MKMYKVLDTKNNKEMEITKNLIGQTFKGIDNGREICLKVGILGGVYFNYNDLEVIEDIKIYDITVDLTEEQKEQLQNAANTEYINATDKEHKETLRQFGINFGDLVEWMTDTDRINCFGTSNYYTILNIEQPTMSNIVDSILG